MRLTSRLVGLVVVASVAAAGPAPVSAQGTGSPERVFVTVDGSYRVSSDDFRDGTSFRVNGEDGRFDTTYAVERGPALDVSGGVRVWRNVGVGGGFSRFAREVPVAITASVPHPFFFNRPRAVSGEVTGVRREEEAIHIQARGVFGVFGVNHVQLTVFGGPSFFRVKQGMVTSFDSNEEYPYDVATFRQATTTIAETSTVGFHVGGDLAYFFTRHVGVGLGAHAARANVDVPSAAGDSVSLKVGGVQAGAGLRLRF